MRSRCAYRLIIAAVRTPGKIAVIGGCKEYTGAPYFAAISALKIVRPLTLNSIQRCPSLHSIKYGMALHNTGTGHERKPAPCVLHSASESPHTENQLDLHTYATFCPALIRRERYPFFHSFTLDSYQRDPNRYLGPWSGGRSLPCHVLQRGGSGYQELQP